VGGDIHSWSVAHCGSRAVFRYELVNRYIQDGMGAIQALQLAARNSGGGGLLGDTDAGF
jgi:hypothetical protein